MCIIYYLPIGQDIPTADIKRGFKYNQHGCGLAYVDNHEKIQVFKTLKLKEFIREFRTRQKQFPDSPFLLHLRAKTHGKPTIDNVHPFWINETQIFMHNGTIYPEAPEDKEANISDTRLFNQNVLKHMPFQWEINKGCRRLIEDYIGRSRIIVLDNQKTVTIFNESADGDSGKAHWHDGVWYSNDYYKKDFKKKENKKRTYWGGYGYNYDNYWDDDDNWTKPNNDGAEIISNDINSKHYKPNNAQWFGRTSKRWMRKFGAVDHAWCWDTKRWRPWNISKFEFTDKAEVIELKEKDVISKTKCESCKKSFDWFDVKLYKDDFQGHHELCFTCCKEFREIGFNLTIDHKERKAN